MGKSHRMRRRGVSVLDIVRFCGQTTVVLIELHYSLFTRFPITRLPPGAKSSGMTSCGNDTIPVCHIIVPVRLCLHLY